jgi:hypothetical protein
MNRRGQALVEIGPIILLLIIILFGIIETSRLSLVYITLADAARAGVRYAIVNGTDSGTNQSGYNTTQGTSLVSGQAQGITSSAGLSGVTIRQHRGRSLRESDRRSGNGDRVLCICARYWTQLVQLPELNLKQHQSGNDLLLKIRI